MPLKQTVAIIGATEAIGSALAHRIAAGPYSLLLSSAEEGRAAVLSADILAANPGAEVEPLACAFDACWEADIIVFAVPPHHHREMTEKVRAVANQKIVIALLKRGEEAHDTSFNDAAISAVAQLRALLPNSKVVVAVIALHAPAAYRADADKRPADALVFGKDSWALQGAEALLKSAGFRVAKGNGPAASDRKAA